MKKAIYVADKTKLGVGFYKNDELVIPIEVRKIAGTNRFEFLSSNRRLGMSYDTAMNAWLGALEMFSVSIEYLKKKDFKEIFKDDLKEYKDGK